MKYFQSLDNANNKKFVAAFKKKCGEKSVIGDVTQAAYLGPWLWKLTVEKAGSFDVDKIAAASPGIEFKGAPEGYVKHPPEPSPLEQDPRRPGAGRWPVRGRLRIAGPDRAEPVPQGLPVSRYE